MQVYKHLDFEPGGRWMQCPAAFSFALCLRSIEQRSASPNVRFEAHYGLNSDIARGPKNAKSRLMHRNKHYSITSSARASSVGGIVSPSCFAVLMLTTSGNWVGNSASRRAVYRAGFYRRNRRNENSTSANRPHS